MFAPLKLEKNDQVLDIGTGSGAWIMDLANHVDPSVLIVGVDIEPQLFPPSLPENVKFRIESVLSLPLEWSNTFSLVHQRLLIVALQAAQWPLALKEIYRVLRPGGWVQLTETTPLEEGGNATEKPSLKQLNAIYWRVAQACNLDVECAYNMPKMLQHAGFVDICSESRVQRMGKWAGESGVAMRDNQISVLRGMKTPVLQAGGFGVVSSGDEYERLLDGLGKELDEGPGIRKDCITFWAQKPLGGCL